MHPRLCVPALLLAGLWLGSSSEPATAQLPGKETNVVYVGVTREVRMSENQFIKAVRSDNPKVATVVLRKDDPRVALVTGLMEGIARITLTDMKDKTEELVITVTTAQAEQQFLLLQRMAEQRRAALEKMIKDTVPTANVQVLVFGWTVVLKGTILKAEDGQFIMEMARSVYPEFQDPNSLTNQAAAAGQPTPYGPQPLAQGQGRGPLIVNALRIGGVQQVTIEVVVTRVNRSEMRNMTFNFLINHDSYYFGSSIKSPQSLASTILPAIGGSAATIATAGSNLPFGFITDKHSFIGFLEALRTEGLAKFYGNTSVTTLSGRPAYIVNGGEVPVLTSSGTGAPSVSYKQFGTVVNFLPIVMGDGKILLEVRPEVSAKNDANGLFIAGVTPTSVPGFDTRSAQVTVTMEDGQTMAIGGLIQNNIDATANKVPVLGDLPFFGAAFRSVSYRESEEELLILVTPRLVDAMACCQLPKYLPGQETRSPDDFELFLEGILEAPRGQRTALCGLNYMAAHTTGPTAGHYPCGDNCGGGFFGRCNDSEQAMICNRQSRNTCRTGACGTCGTCGTSGTCGNAGNCNSCISNGYNGHGYNGNNGYNGSPTLGRAMPYPSLVNPGVQVEPTTPTTPSFAFPSVVPNPAFPNTSPAQPRELPFSTPPALPGGRELPPVPQAPMGGGLPPISRTPPGLQGAYGDIPLSPASLGPVIE